MNSGSFSNSLTGIFKDISLVHEEAKTIYLRAEALCLDGDLFFQPMKEQRDAEEHLVRALGKMANGGYFEYASKAAGIDDEAESYVIGNLEKAFNYEQRALVDASEWLLLVVKTMFTQVYDYYSTDTSNSCVSGEMNLIFSKRGEILDCGRDLAQLRDDKDVKRSHFMEKDFTQYREIALRLLQAADALNNWI